MAVRSLGREVLGLVPEQVSVVVILYQRSLESRSFPPPYPSGQSGTFARMIIIFRAAAICAIFPVSEGTQLVSSGT